MSSIRLYLDVDGVINVISSYLTGEASTAGGWRDYENVEVDGYRIVYSPSMIARLRSLSERVEVIFCTTWEETVSELAPALGLPVFSHLELWDHQHGSIFSKAEAIGIHRRENPADHVLWADDHHQGLSPEHKRELLDLAGESIHLVSPQSRVGLTVGQVDRMDALVKEWS